MLKRYYSLIAKAKHSLYVQQVTTLVSGTSVAHFITIAVSPVLTRLFPAEAFGELQLFHSLVILLTIISSGCFEYTFVLPEKDRDAAILFRLSLLLNFVFCFLFYASVYILISYTELLDDVEAIFLWLLPAGVFFNTALNILTRWFIRFEQYGDASRAKILQSSTIAGTQSGIGLYHIITGGLIIGHIFGRMVSVIYLFLKRKKIQLSPSFLKLNRSMISRKYFNTTKFLIPSNILSYGAIEIPVFVIGLLFDQQLLGFYALAYRVLSVPAAFIGNSVGQVFFKQLSDRFNRGNEIRTFIYRTWGILFLITLIPTAALLLFSEPIFSFVFGEEWMMAGTVAMYLAPLLAIDFISAPTGKALIVLEKQHMMPLFSMFNLTARAGGLYIGWIQSDFILGLIFLTIGHSIGLILYNAYLLKAVFRYEKNGTITPS